MASFYDDTAKTLKFYADNVEITNKVVYDSLSIEDILVDEQLDFGACNSARMQMQTTEDLSLTNKKIKVTYSTSDGTVATVGTYKVTYSKSKVNSTVMQITAYDCVDEFNKDVANWYKQLSWTNMTVKTFRDSLCAYVGITQESVALPNDSLSLSRTIEVDTLNGKDVLAWIGQINGVFPHATDDYKLKWVQLGTEMRSVLDTWVIGYESFIAKSFTTYDINKIRIMSEDGDVGIEYGTGANCFEIIGNPLTYGCTDATKQYIEQTLLGSTVGDARPYTPCEILIKYTPDIKVGDWLRYKGKDFYVLKRELSNNVLQMKITCDGKEYLEEGNDIYSQIKAIKGKSNVLKRDIDTNAARIEDVNDGLTSEITQTKDTLTAQIELLSREIDNDVVVYTVTEVPTLDNYPACDWFEEYYPPASDDSALDYQFPGDYTWLYSYESYKKHLGSICYLDGSTDSYRFCVDDNQVFYFKLLANTETAAIMKKVTALELTVDGIEASVEDVEERVTAQGVLIANNATAITEANNQITLKVSKTDYATDKKNITDAIAANTSLIEQTAEDILLSVSGTYQTKDAMSGYSTTTQMNSAISSAVSSEDASIKLYITSVKENIDESIADVDDKAKDAQSTANDAQTTADEAQAYIDLHCYTDEDDDKLISAITGYADIITFEAETKLELLSNNIHIKSTDDDGNVKFELTDEGNITANSGKIGAWNIASNGGLYTDYGDYRVWMNTPYEENAWIYSIQKKATGSTYSNVFKVDREGDINTTGELRGTNFYLGTGETSTNYIMGSLTLGHRGGVHTGFKLNVNGGGIWTDGNFSGEGMMLNGNVTAGRLYGYNGQKQVVMASNEDTEIIITYSDGNLYFYANGELVGTLN